MPPKWGTRKKEIASILDKPSDQETEDPVGEKDHESLAGTHPG